MACNDASLATSSSERSFNSIAPSLTSSPELNEIESTTPATSSDRSAPRTARKLPTASMVGCQLDECAVIADTVCGGALIVLMNFLIMAALNDWNQKMPPNTTPTASSMITIRF